MGSWTIDDSTDFDLATAHQTRRPKKTRAPRTANGNTFTRSAISISSTDAKIRPFTVVPDYSKILKARPGLNIPAKAARWSPREPMGSGRRI